MRILIYIEPYPLRNEMDHYRDIAISFADMLVRGVDHPDFQEHDIRIFSNRETLTRVQETSFASKRFLLWPEREEMDLFRGGLTDWTTGGIEGWQQLLRGEGEITQAYADVIEAVHQRFPFDVILHWGENGAARAFSHKHGVVSVIAAPGGLRAPQRDTVFLDTGGSGATALLATVPLKALLSAAEGFSWPAGAELNALTGEKPLEVAQALYGPVNFTGCEHVLNRGEQRAAFIPLAPHDDPEFLAHSGFSSPADFLTETIVPLAKRKIVCVVRPERACWEAVGGESAMRDARAAISAYRDKILWIDPRTEPVSLQQLFNLTDVVVAATGHAAFQALLFDRPVSLVGEAYFKTEGIFYRPEDVIRGRIYRKGYPPAIRALRTFMLRAHLMDREILFDFEPFMQRLSDAVANVDRLEEKPVEVLRELMSAYSPDNGPDLIRDRLPVSPPAAGPAAAEAEEENGATAGKVSILGKIMRKARKPLRNRAATGAAAKDQTTEDAAGTSSDETSFALSEEERGAIELARTVLRTQTRRRRKLAVILHAFYHDTAMRLLDCLKRVPEPFDLIVTVPEFGADRIERDILTRRPSAIVVPLPNRGEHIWPFCFVLKELGLDRYETVLKLHTKKHLQASNGAAEQLGAAWLDYAVACLLGRIDTTEHVSGLLESRESWSLAGPSGLFTNAEQDTASAEAELQAFALAPPETWATFAGALFWANPGTFAPLLPALADPERYAPPYTVFPHEFTQTAELLLSTAATYADAPAAGLLPDVPEPDVGLETIPGHIEEVLKTFAAAP